MCHLYNWSAVVKVFFNDVEYIYGIAIGYLFTTFDFINLLFGHSHSNDVLDILFWKARKE